MATKQSEMTGSAFTSSTHKLGMLRLGATGGVAAAVIFVLCWIGTFIPFSSPTHAFVGLFTPAEMTSVQALVEGTCWSLLFGAISGAVIAIVYNLFAGLDRR